VNARDIPHFYSIHFLKGLSGLDWRHFTG